MNHTSVEDNHLAADTGKVMGHFESAKKRMLRQDVLEQFSEGWNIPLAFSEFVDDFALGGGTVDLKNTVERFVRRK